MMFAIWRCGCTSTHPNLLALQAVFLSNSLSMQHAHEHMLAESQNVRTIRNVLVAVDGGKVEAAHVTDVVGTWHLPAGGQNGVGGWRLDHHLDWLCISINDSMAVLPSWQNVWVLRQSSWNKAPGMTMHSNTGMLMELDAIIGMHA